MTKKYKYTRKTYDVKSNFWFDGAIRDCNLNPKVFTKIQWLKDFKRILKTVRPDISKKGKWKIKASYTWSWHIKHGYLVEI